ncbi:hypothetical protein [Thermus thermophilus]|uniref:hypothetical protein n=1 Tax=Thermus thermophilus TaxID=274 RepID=UPI001FCBE2A3|nr:hypothetical protein [Thermus thermophilus]BDG25214.1 hypothetical protein TthSNM33_24080 [Thermus thermophilus]BDG29769.1 hypothetical protein TthSNM76_19790 [Thermus thermophilus]
MRRWLLGPKVAALALFLLAGCGGQLNLCWTCGGGATDPPFRVYLEPTYQRVKRGETARFSLRVVSDYPSIPFGGIVCLRDDRGNPPPPGIGWGEGCLLFRVEGEARLEPAVEVAPSASPGVYRLRFEVSNSSLIRYAPFALEVE